MRAHINHVSKLEFLCTFRETFFASMTEKNIQGGFAGAGLIPYDPERVLSKLDVQLQTPGLVRQSHGFQRHHKTLLKLIHKPILLRIAFQTIRIAHQPQCLMLLIDLQRGQRQ